GDRARLLGSLAQHGVERGLVRAQLLVALADRRQVVDDRVRHRLLELAVARALELALDLVGRRLAHHGQDVDQVRDPLLVGAAPQSVTALFTFLTIVAGSSSTRIVPASLSAVVDIFWFGACRSMIRAPTSGMRCSGTTSVSPKRALKRSAMSRASSRCWRWSS